MGVARRAPATDEDEVAGNPTASMTETYDGVTVVRRLSVDRAPRAGLPERLLSVAAMAGGVGAVIVALAILAAREPGSFGTWWPWLAAPAIWLGVFAAFGLYRRRPHDPLSQMRRVPAAVATASGIIGVALPWRQAPGRASVLLAVAVALGLEFSARAGVRALQIALRRRGHFLKRAVIVGADESVDWLLESGDPIVMGAIPLGFVAVGVPDPSVNGFPMLGDIERIAEIVDRTGADMLILAERAVSASDVRRVLRIARYRGLEVRMTSKLPPLLEDCVGIDRSLGSPLLDIRTPQLGRSRRAAKRTYDVVVATVGGLLSAPLWIAGALVVRLTSRGPVLFRQERVTANGRVFRMLKFRTMVENADELELGLDTTAAFFKIEDDPRLTRAGRILRRLSIDELPQLLNILKGDMSVVGPRPLPVEQVRAHEHELSDRHEMKAGLTGWWQVSGRSRIGADDAVSLDLFYIENWSLWLDVYITCRTLGAVFRGGAY